MTGMSTPQVSFGRRAPKNAPALSFSALLKETLPTPPKTVNYGKDFTGWLILGNDVVGDCAAVTWANQRALVTTVLAGTTDYPDQEQVFAFYKTQNPDFDPTGTKQTNGPGSPDDHGMDIQTALEYLQKTGGPDGVKAVAFAKVDYTNQVELRSAHSIFGQVWYGISVFDQNQTEFFADKPWTYIKSTATPDGHSITGVGYTPTDYYFVTWGKETQWDEGFREHQVDEAWIVIWPEHLGTKEFQEGINLDALASDYESITGRKLTLPASA